MAHALDPRHLELISLSHAHGRCAWTPTYARCATARSQGVLLDAAIFLSDGTFVLFSCRHDRDHQATSSTLLPLCQRSVDDLDAHVRIVQHVRLDNCSRGTNKCSFAAQPIPERILKMRYCTSTSPKWAGGCFQCLPSKNLEDTVSELRSHETFCTNARSCSVKVLRQPFPDGKKNPRRAASSPATRPAASERPDDA